MNLLANWALTDLDTLTAETRRHSRSLQRKPNLLRSFLKHILLFYGFY